MSRLSRCIRIVFAMAVVFTHAYRCWAQGPTAGTPESLAVLTKLSPPVYPPIAVTAHVKGDLELLVNVRKDGSVESATVVSGPPLLELAALSSAKQSQFECHNCVEDLTPYHLFYAFRFDDIPADACTAPDSCNRPIPVGRAPDLVLSKNYTTLTAHPSPVCICEYAKKVRALKCLYLWKCGLHF